MQLSPGNIQSALQLTDFDPLTAQEQMMPQTGLRQRPRAEPGEAREGAVLMLLYQSVDGPRLILIKRCDDLPHHPGQIAFPGGRREDGESLLQTALRETEEEVGVSPAAVTVLGSLTPIYIPPSDFEVYPFVGWHDGGRPAFQPDPREVAELIEVDLAYLRDPAARSHETWWLREEPVEVPYFSLPPHKIWGATAIILCEFLARLERVTNE
jgi:8-oxo-dGTP pyrophosphatase MutT (NUDIX family)